MHKSQPVNTLPVINDLDSFAATYQDSSDKRWLSGLVESGWVTLDWPAGVGGSGFTRSEKLRAITVLCTAGCPVLPEAITVLAPLVIKVLPLKDQQATLNSIRADPFAWCCEIEDGTFYMRYGADRTQLGESGQAVALLASSASALFEISELKSGLSLIHGMNQLWDEGAQVALTEMHVTLNALEVMYLKDNPLLDLQIALKANQAKLEIYSMLFQSLGYYAMLDPNPSMTDNEPLPFERERAHLSRLRLGIYRNEMQQQDLLYEHMDNQMSAEKEP